MLFLDPRRAILMLRLSFPDTRFQWHFEISDSVILRRARITLLSLLALICLTWTILFGILLHHEWSHSSLFQKVVIIGLLSLYFFTASLLYLMAVMHVQHCPWWDVVRMFAIFVVHTGSSVLFTDKRPSFSCHGFGTETACKEFIFTIFVGCWVFSGIFLCMALLLGVMAFSENDWPQWYYD
ncbi:hypothetical protein BGY98DRAFT_941521 [Russula aff. rugulosa BPL654]|nr:hypothetical protein BGY98DRAFT_941521 [Russula aff. rugulosa BPL654]